MCLVISFDTSHSRAVPPATLTHGSLSQSFDALARNLERPLKAAECESWPWQEGDAEPTGFAVIYRYRTVLHLQVSFQGDFSKRLDPQPGIKLVSARTHIDSVRDQVKKLYRLQRRR